MHRGRNVAQCHRTSQLSSLSERRKRGSQSLVHGIISGVRLQVNLPVTTAGICCLPLVITTQRARDNSLRTRAPSALGIFPYRGLRACNDDEEEGRDKLRMMLVTNLVKFVYPFVAGLFANKLRSTFTVTRATSRCNYCYVAYAQPPPL